VYRANNNAKVFNFTHCFTKLKRCEKWWLTRIKLKKAGEGVINLDAPLVTSADHPISNKKSQIILNG
jgi:hypothetical protein